MEKEAVRALVVDDYGPIRELTGEMLEHIFEQKAVEFEFDMAGDLKAAFQLLDRNRYQLIITDLSLSGNGSIDGLSVIKYANSQEQDFAWLLMTGELLPKAKVEAKKLSVVAFLEKPFDMRAIHDSVVLALGWK